MAILPSRLARGSQGRPLPCTYVHTYIGVQHALQTQRQTQFRQESLAGRAGLQENYVAPASPSGEYASRGNPIHRQRGHPLGHEGASRHSVVMRRASSELFFSLVSPAAVLRYVSRYTNVQDKSDGRARNLVRDGAGLGGLLDPSQARPRVAGAAEMTKALR